MGVTVLKVGGSVLSGPESWWPVASWLRERLAAGEHAESAGPAKRAGHGREGLVVVVSAQKGATDALWREASAVREAEPDACAVDLLWSTGELRSVALLALALARGGVEAVPLNVHQTGLVARRGCVLSADVRAIRAALARAPVAIVPGFLGRDEAGAVVSLGRGGSDLTAVILAQALGARCELIKDVPGYFTADPRRDAAAVHVPSLSYDEALARADAGCGVVQRGAIALAAKAGVPLCIRSLDRHATHTVVGHTA